MTMPDNMNIQATIEELRSKGVIDFVPTAHRELSGGTMSSLSAIYKDGLPYCVIKRNSPPIVEAEAAFLRTYAQAGLLPRLLYTDPGNRYLVYTYMPGSTAYTKGRKAALMKTLVESFLGSYTTVQLERGFGYFDEPVGSWNEFLTWRAAGAREVIGELLPETDYDLIHTLIHKTAFPADGQGAYLLHGDCGVHNFLFEGDSLAGIIDPTPVIGDPIYDLLYAFCSSPDDLTLETLQPAADVFCRLFPLRRALHE